MNNCLPFAIVAAGALLISNNAPAQLMVSDRLIAHYRFDGAAYDSKGTAHGAALQAGSALTGLDGQAARSHSPALPARRS